MSVYFLKCYNFSLTCLNEYKDVRQKIIVIRSLSKFFKVTCKVGLSQDLLK